MRPLCVVVLLLLAGCGPYRQCWNEREDKRTTRTCCQCVEWTGPAVLGSWEPAGQVVCAPVRTEKVLE